MLLLWWMKWNTLFGFVFFSFHQQANKSHKIRSPAFDQKNLHTIWRAWKRFAVSFPRKNRLEVFGKYAAVQRAFEAKKKKRLICWNFPWSSCLLGSSDIPRASWDTDERPGEETRNTEGSEKHEDEERWTRLRRTGWDRVMRRRRKGT